MNHHHVVAAALFGALLLSGCAASDGPNPSQRCSAELACGPGRVCDRGYCIEANSADAGNPPPPDAGTTPDIGLPACMMPRDQTRCGLVCVKLDDDFFHCGECFNACAVGERCKRAVCEPD